MGFAFFCFHPCFETFYVSDELSFSKVKVLLLFKDHKGNNLSPVNYYWLTPLKQVDLLPAKLSVDHVSTDENENTITVRLSTDAVAPWVTLSSPTTGVWSDNVLVLLPGENVSHFACLFFFFNFYFDFQNKPFLGRQQNKKSRSCFFLLLMRRKLLLLQKQI